jgi:hypothetical protein
MQLTDVKRELIMANEKDFWRVIGFKLNISGIFLLGVKSRSATF